MQNILRAIASTAVFTAATMAVAQGEAKQISGVVKSDLGTVVSGVSVCIKGQQQCAETDEYGRYKINAQKGDVLVFSNEGYATTEVLVGNDDEIDTKMLIEDLFALDIEDIMNMQVQSSSFLTLTAKEAPGYTFKFDLGEQVSQQSLIDIIKMIIPSYSDGSHTDTEIFGVRGMKIVDNSKSIVMFDGQNLNLRSNVGYSVGLNSMLLGDVKGLEVSLGPNAIVHGSGAISGYINMVPKNGFDNNGFYINVNKEFEKHAVNQASGISKAEIGYGFGSKTRNGYFYAGWYHSNGWTADSAFFCNQLVDKYNITVADELADKPFGSTPRANFRLAGYGNFDDFNLQVGYTQASRTSYLYYSQGSGRETTYQYGLLENFTRQFNARLKWNHNFNEYENLTASVSSELTDIGRMKRGYQEGGCESHIEAKIVASTKRIANNQLAIGGLVGGRKFNMRDYFFGHDVPYSEADQVNKNNYKFDPTTKDGYRTESYDPETGELLTDSKNNPVMVYDPAYELRNGQMPDGKWNEWAIFLEDIYKIQDKVVIALGLRYDVFNVDEFSDTQSNLSPRIGASWLVNDNHVVKASYQQGFRTMDFYNYAQTYYQKNPLLQNYLMAGNVEGGENFTLKIDPERLHSFELNYRGDFFSKAFTLEANVFFNRYKETIDYLKLVEWEGKKSSSYTGEDRIDVGEYNGDLTATGKSYLNDEQKTAIAEYYFKVNKKYLKNGEDSNFSAYVNNGEDIDIIGGEAIATVSLPSFTDIRVAYSIAKSNTDSYSKTTIAPEQNIKAGFMQHLCKGKLLVSAQYLWEPALENNAENAENYNEVYFDSRNLLDATISFKPISALQIYVMANNLLGETRPCLTYKPDPTNNYPQLTQLGCGERRFWVGFKVNL